jgi:uncharacterized protein (DUF1330 family)
MFGKPVHKLRPPLVYDYSSAIAKTVEWLGDRYLLAKSINATPQSPYTRGRRATLPFKHYELHRGQTDSRDYPPASKSRPR